MRVETYRAFDRQYKALPEAIKNLTLEKVAIYCDDPSHPSLRVKRVRGTRDIWELSVTMNHRVTFEIGEEIMILRRIGTHDVLRNP
mgnify:CR=1 FL=1